MSLVAAVDDERLLLITTLAVHTAKLWFPKTHQLLGRQRGSLHSPYASHHTVDMWQKNVAFKVSQMLWTSTTNPEWVLKDYINVRSLARLEITALLCERQELLWGGVSRHLQQRLETSTARERQPANMCQVDLPKLKTLMLNVVGWLPQLHAPSAT